MTAEEFADWAGPAQLAYAADIAGSGVLPEAAARDKARDDFAALLPDGLNTAGQHLWSAWSGPDRVGMIWIGEQVRPDGLTGFVFDVQVDPDQRRRGHGRAIMLAVEDRCRALGMNAVALNVFGQNLTARRLYTSLGYQEVSLDMRKPIAPAAPG